MNKEQFEGKWNQIKGKVKQRWGKLTDQDLTEIEGNFDQLSGKLQERYGLAKEKAEKEVKDFQTHNGRQNHDRS